MSKKIIGLCLLLVLVAYGFWGNNWSVRDDLYPGYPEISNALFSIHDNVVKIEFDYKGVVGHIRDAKMNLTIGVAIKRHKDRLEPLYFKIGGWKGLFWSVEDNRRITRGTITTEVVLPDYVAINQNSPITIFGLGFKNPGGLVAKPFIVEGEIIHETRIARIFRLLKEALA